MTEKKLPKGWKTVKFGDIAKHISKRVDPSETDLDIYVGLEHLDPGSLKIKRHGVPSEVSGQKLFVKKGQIIFGKRRAYQRKVAVADWNCICSAHAMVLEANPENMSSEFLPFFMQSDAFMKRAVEISEGSLSPTIKWKVLANQSFMVPNMEEQKRLAGILDFSLKARVLNDILKDKAFRIFRSLIDSRIVGSLYNHENSTVHENLGRIPSGWTATRLGEVCELIIDCKNRTPTYIGEGIPVLRTSNIRNGNICWDDMKYTHEQDYSTWTERGEPQEGDLIITREAPIGEVCLIPPNTKICMGQRMMLFRVNSELMSPDFIRYFCMSRFFQRQLLALANGSTVGHVRVGELKKTYVLVPSKSDQKKLVNVLKLLESTLKILERKANELSKLSSALVEWKHV